MSNYSNNSSNAGGNHINRQLYEHLVSGKKREQFQYTDINRALATSTYNKVGRLFLFLYFFQ